MFQIAHWLWIALREVLVSGPVALASVDLPPGIQGSISQTHKGSCSSDAWLCSPISEQFRRSIAGFVHETLVPDQPIIFLDSCCCYESKFVMALMLSIRVSVHIAEIILYYITGLVVTRRHSIKSILSCIENSFKGKWCLNLYFWGNHIFCLLWKTISAS